MAKRISRPSNVSINPDAREQRGIRIAGFHQVKSGPIRCLSSSCSSTSASAPTSTNSVSPSSTAGEMDTNSEIGVDNTIVISNDDSLEVSCIDLTDDDDVIEIQGSDASFNQEEAGTSTITLRNRRVIRNHSTPRQTRSQNSPSVVTLSQESDDELPELVMEKKKRKANTPDKTKSNDFSLSCPVCLDDYKEVKNSDRQMVSTLCGHLFCDSCLKTCLEESKCCPNCRKRLTKKQFHPIYF